MRFSGFVASARNLRHATTFSTLQRQARFASGALATCALLLAALTPAELAAQAGGTITGRVTDVASGSPIGQASVLVTGTTVGTQTADDGSFTLLVPTAGTITLRVTRIGYEARQLPLTVVSGETQTANFTLSAASYSLTSVVVTATGMQRKVEIPNATTQINVADKIAEAPASSIGNLLSGRAAGLQVISTGTTGVGARIRIRGQSSLSLNNEPVVIIDGVRMSSSSNSTAIGTGGDGPSRLDDLNPEEIESIEVIKGPSAATLYGTEAANGVINITTKRGRAGATRYNVYTENGIIDDLTDYPDLYFGWGHNAAGAPTQCLAVSVAAGTCVQDSLSHGNILNQPSRTPINQGIRSQYGMQVSGGSERVQYFVSAETEKEQGIYKMPQKEIDRLLLERGVSELPSNQVYPNALNRNSLRANITALLSDKATLQVSSGYVNSTTRQPQNNNNGNGLMVNALGGFYRFDLKDSRGIALDGYRSFPMGDVLSETTEQGISRFINSAQLQYLPFAWLSTRATVGVDFTQRADRGMQLFGEGITGSNRLGTINEQRSTILQQTVEFGGTATFQPFTWMGSKTSVGMQYIRNYFTQVGATGEQLPPGGTTVSAAAIRNGNQSSDEKRTLGYYVEQVFDVNDKLFVTAALRRDAASAFGSDFRAVYYPKFGASWVVSDYDFFPKTDLISSFRLRGTYGASGQIPGTTAALKYYSPRATQLGDQLVPGVTLGSLGNTELKPEYSAEIEAGFDLALYNGRSNLDLTYYNKTTTDALISRRIAPSIAGVSSRYENIGEINNQGFEMVFNQTVIDRESIGFDFLLTASTNKNELIKLGEGVNPIFTGNRNTQKNTEGYPLYGLWQQTYTINDADGNGIVSPNELTYSDTAEFIGPTYPTREAVFSPSIQLFDRKLRLNAQIERKWGVTKFNNTLRHQCQGGQSCQGRYDTNAPLEIQAKSVAAQSGVFTGFMEDGSYTRFRELSLSYEMPTGWANAFRAERWMVVLTGRNLGVWTDYTGVDPEASARSNDDDGNTEYFSTPPLRQLMFRMNFTF